MQLYSRNIMLFFQKSVYSGQTWCQETETYSVKAKVKMWWIVKITILGKSKENLYTARLYGDGGPA